MARFRNSRTGVVVNVGDDVAARLSGEWKPRDEQAPEKSDRSEVPDDKPAPPKSRPARRRSSKN